MNITNTRKKQNLMIYEKFFVNNSKTKIDRY